ncbi:MAG: glycoside hydrolase family 25 protein [Erythrobacter sp.]|uniref:glycoside hydrolase family 25 protein n=1 Tax=Erythrobacter sp. TaxID=1042 RepID=UPI00262CD93D|nr:glycoside hydrolase family 25 protein [Erythrobacter sp.]MDJ0979349.1 glycoside hydrolase family 25 protein [Erythrobacter sp.]
MASSTRKRKSRQSGHGLARRLAQLAALAGLVALVFAGWFWFEMRTWRPDPELYPEQGAVVDSGVSGVRFETLKATGAAFVYLELGSARMPPDPGFRARLRAARDSGLKVGILQVFDPCQRADPQSALFTRMVARDLDLLPPAVALERLPKDCTPRVSQAAAKSEVLTLVNQIEMHSGQPVILKLGEAFEKRFQIAGALDRDLWLARDRLRPRYAQRPWLLWSANRQMVSQALAEPIEWVVVQR